MKTALVLGVGFIGKHLVDRLKLLGFWVRGVDIKEPEFGHACDEFLLLDLTVPQNTERSIRADYDLNNGRPFDEVYVTAALMGGANFIFTGKNDAEIIHDSAMINLNACYYANLHNVKKIFFSSSACVYPEHIQNSTDNPGLKEKDAWPAQPDSIYGIEKLFSEQVYSSYRKNHGLNVRIARFHNIYGPYGTYTEPKAKAPAALCRKVIKATNAIEIIGDGEQTRSFLYIDDCIDAVMLLMANDHFTDPINIGSEEMVSINHLAKLAMEIAGKDLQVNYVDGPQGVRGRNSNNDLIRTILDWKPKYSLREGLEITYKWIAQEVEKQKK